MQQDHNCSALKRIQTMAEKGLTELKEERDKTNQLYEHIDYLSGLLMCLMQKHHYTTLKFPVEHVAEAVKTHSIRTSGGEDQKTTIVEMMTKPVAYDDFVAKPHAG